MKINDFRGELTDILAKKESLICSFGDCDIALFSAGGSISKKYGPIASAAKCTVVDNSSAFRMTDGVPLVIPEVNPEAMSHIKVCLLLSTSSRQVRLSQSTQRNCFSQRGLVAYHRTGNYWISWILYHRHLKFYHAIGRSHQISQLTAQEGLHHAFGTSHVCFSLQGLKASYAASNVFCS